jgi:hypothetical protein
MDAEVETLKRQVKELRRQVKFFSDWHDTCHSPLYKRLFWWFLGYRFFSLGTWYKARWNQNARKYD